MKVVKHYPSTCSGPVSMETFAELHGLELHIHRRNDKSGTSMEFYATFDCVEVSGDGMLVSTYGDGCTPQDAVGNYAARIAGKRLVHGAYTSGRREFIAPSTLYVAGNYND